MRAARRSSGIADECVPRAHHGEHRARRAARAAAAAHAALAAVAHAAIRWRAASSPRRRRSRSRSARAASTIRRRTRSSSCGSKYDGNALAAPPSDPASIPSLLEDPTAANLIRVFRLQERLKALGKEGDVQGGARARRRRRHDGRRHRRVVRAARPHGHAAGPERRAPGARDGARGASSSPSACAIRAACATRRDRLIPDVAGDGVARADVIIEAIFENVDAKRALFAARREEGEARRDPRDQHVEHSARGDRDGAAPIRRGSSASTSSTRCAQHDAGRGRASAATTRRTLVARGRGVRAPDRQAAAAGEERAGLPRQSHARAVPDGGDALPSTKASRPETVDEAALAFGMPMGPIELADTVGLDICVAVGKLLGGRRRAAEAS